MSLLLVEKHLLVVKAMSLLLVVTVVEKHLLLNLLVVTVVEKHLLLNLLVVAVVEKHLLLNLLVVADLLLLLRGK